MRIRNLALIPLTALLVITGLALSDPLPAAAQKLPVDCSGRFAACYTNRSCSLWQSHVCHEYTTTFWYWYYSDPNAPVR